MVFERLIDVVHIELDLVVHIVFVCVELFTVVGGFVAHHLLHDLHRWILLLFVGNNRDLMQCNASRGKLKIDHLRRVCFHRFGYPAIAHHGCHQGVGSVVGFHAVVAFLIGGGSDLTAFEKDVHKRHDLTRSGV